MYVNGGSVIAIGIVFPILGIFAVSARFYTRKKCTIGFGIDDWLCPPALILICATGGLLIAGSEKHVIGYHSTPQTADQDAQQALLLRIEFAINLMNPVCTGLIRLTFLFLYRRIFRGRVFNIVSWTAICVVIGWSLIFFIAFLSSCKSHISAMWTSFQMSDEDCITEFQHIGLTDISGFILDCIIFSIPFFWIWRLHMNTSQKLAVTSIFLCGLFGLCASALRVVANTETLHYKSGGQSNVLGLQSNNDTYGVISMYLFWQYIENGVGMVVCCLPTLGPIFKDRGSGLHAQNLRTIMSRVLFGGLDRGNSSAHKPSQSSKSSLPEVNEIRVTRTVEQERVERPAATFNDPMSSGSTKWDKRSHSTTWCYRDIP